MDDVVFFFLGIAVAAVVFINNDPAVYRHEIERVSVLCADHKGVDRIETNVLPGWVSGRCADGLSFDMYFPIKQ